MAIDNKSLTIIRNTTMGNLYKWNQNHAEEKNPLGNWDSFHFNLWISNKKQKGQRMWRSLRWEKVTETTLQVRVVHWHELKKAEQNKLDKDSSRTHK